MQLSATLSLRYRRTKTRLFVPKISNFDSSLQRTLFQSSKVQFLCCRTQSSLFFLFITFKSGFDTATHPFRPAFKSRLFTVDTLTGLLRLSLTRAVISGAVSPVTFALHYNISIFRRSRCFWSTLARIVDNGTLSYKFLHIVVNSLSWYVQFCCDLSITLFGLMKSDNYASLLFR